MIYRCRNCQHEEVYGCLPAVSCGALLLIQIGLCVAISVPGFWHIRKAANAAAISTGGEAGVEPGWWAILLVPAFLIFALSVLLVMAMVINLIMEFAEWITVSFRRCPKCQSRRWSWGYTRGFGL